MLKVLYLPLGAQSGTYDGWNNIGVHLQIYDYWSAWLHHHDRNRIKNEFLTHVRDFKPDLIHTQLQLTGLLDASAITEARRICPNVIITNWSGDCRDHAPSTFTSIANAVDYSLISNTGQLELYKQAGCTNMRYWQIGYDPKVAFPSNNTEFTYDISFIGNNYGTTFPDGPLRLNAAHALTNNFGAKFGLFGSNYNITSRITHSPQESNSVYNNSLCVLSISNFNNISHYFSDRLLLCLASGRPTISWYFPGCENYFVEGSEIFIARSNQDIIEIVKYCKANPDIANKVGRNGYKRVLKEHTFTSRIIELLNMTNLIHLV